ncbi:hypothetical protein ['Paenibacillus yunnanensis' Narsing Rao et al. 2020]|uniref:hypothetical protein n=1 Tax=Paenibacillus tengchongensis TaxID=2608684 RepID=UPI001651CD7D|nr:hypothetical protein [Paenibacillus tengchongensis]
MFKENLKKLLLALRPLIFIYTATLVVHAVTFIVQAMESLVVNSYDLGYAVGSFLEKAF